MISRYKETAVEEQPFWQIIAAGGRKALADAEQQLAAVRKELLKLTPAEIKAFDKLFNQKMAAAFTWDLWGPLT